ncbi:selenium cofactor biosynthesis protein YqeC [Natronolimnobius baerhuensis]|uniref:Dehydrogenase n=1 Tax=Natronolimnobius baerhuensis TaxID=253108 RepID=A0A202EBY7_9EURY|nr:selenium cofactor biosynthesis protein YqeC [Natronolimnobius baerhuensis]OVE85510.1 dehydrogenase [Natronolimnobius baerhuensis]
MDLPSALEAEGNTVCVVGAGGKKSTLYALAGHLERAVVTATVRIPPFDDQVAEVRVTANPSQILENATDWPLGLVADRDGERCHGYEPEQIDALASVASDTTILVKADGARTRWFKAPGEHEPQLPTTTDVVVPIASAKIVGETLTDEHVHRPERVAAITGLERGDRIAVTDVATVLTSDRGGCKDVPDGATVIPLLNMVDTPALESTARDLAAEIHALRNVPHVALTRLLEDEPVIGVV